MLGRAGAVDGSTGTCKKSSIVNLLSFFLSSEFPSLTQVRRGKTIVLRTSIICEFKRDSKSSTRKGAVRSSDCFGRTIDNTNEL